MHNLKTILQEKADNFIGKYKEVITDKEHEHLKSYHYKLVDFYVLSKLPKVYNLIKSLHKTR